MKKILAILLAAMMVFALAACGDNDTTDPDKDNPGVSQSGENNEDQGGENSTVNPEDIDFAAIMAGNGATDVVWGKQDEATKQAIIADAKKDGVDVSFGTDGSMTVVDTDGTTMVQKPDGTWVVKDADGGEGQIGGDWPDNEFTKLVPKPSFELYAAAVDGDTFSVLFTNATIEQLKAYADQVKAAGFNLNEELTEQNVMGMVIYTFSAENADGYSVEIFSASGSSGMRIDK